MSNLVPLKGGSTGRALLTVGSLDIGEILYDTDEKRAYLNDQSTAGGVPIWHSDLKSSNNKMLIEGSNAATPVNYLRVANANTGSGIALSAQGSDTNVDINVASKGTGNVNLTAASTGDVYLGRSGARIPITKLAGSNPAWTDTGGLFYNATSGEWYTRDLTRSKFLGLSVMAIGFGRNVAPTPASEVLWTHGGWDPDALTNGKGIRIPWNMTIVGYTWNSSSIAASPTLIIRNHTTTLISFTPGAVTGAVDTSDVDVSAGDFLNVIVSANTIDHPHVLVLLKRRS